MKKKVIIPAVLAAAVGGMIGGIAWYMSGEYRLASLAPEQTTVWVEGQNLEQAWELFKQTEAYEDFQRSPSNAFLVRRWEAVLRESQAEWANLGIEPDEETVLNLVGDNVALGFVAGDGTTDPSWVVMTKVDVVGLAGQVAVDGNWRELWKKLREALAGEGAEIEAYEGYDIATREIKDPELSKLTPRVHIVMIEDVLVVSDVKDTVKQIIDINNGDATSLAERPAFVEEMSKLPPEDRVAYSWIDVGFLRDKERVKAVVHKVGKVSGEERLGRFTGDEMDVLMDDLRDDVPSMAVGLYVPEGDPYQAHLETSREVDEIFKDNTTTDIRAVVSEDTMMLIEARATYDLVHGFTRSETLQKVLATRGIEWLREKMRDPQQVSVVTPPQVPRLRQDPSFEIQAAWALVLAMGKELLGNDVGIAIEAEKGEKIEQRVRPLVLLSSRPVMRIAADIALGVLATHSEDSGVEVSEHGDRQVFSYQDGPVGVHCARVGADLVVSTQKELVHRVIDRAGSKEIRGSERFRHTATKLPRDYRAFVYVDGDQLAKLMEVALKDLKIEDEEIQRQVALVRGNLGTLAAALYVDSDFSTVTIRSYQTFGEDVGDGPAQLWTNAAKEPPAWSQMPEDTFLSLAWQTNPQRLFGSLKGIDTLTEGGWSREVKRIEERILAGKSLEKDLVAHLGPSAGLAVAVQQPLPNEGEADPDLIAVPAALAYWELRDPKGLLTFKALAEGVARDLNRHRLTTNEEATQKALEKLSEAQDIFQQGDADGDEELDYAPSLKALHDAKPEFSEFKPLIDAGLASGEQHGYRIQLHSVGESEADYQWMATASPITSGGLHFAVNQDGDVHKARKAIPLDPKCTFPPWAVPMREILPDAEGPQARDANKWRLDTSAEGKTTVWRLVIPDKLRARLPAIGRALTPCFAQVRGYLVIASSEAALRRHIQADTSLADSNRFRELIEGRPIQVAAHGHLDMAGVVEQLKHNSELMARHFATPSSSELSMPAPPQDTFSKDEDEARKEHDAYTRARAKWRSALRRWRRERAGQNAEVLNESLDSTKSLGAVLSWGRIGENAAETTTVWRLELD